MPLYDFRCNTCNKTVEILAKADSAPACPECGGTMEKLVSCPTAPGQSAGIIASGRARAAREGHFSNYKPSERPRSK
jgi:putative FmdB family regulatory protein